MQTYDVAAEGLRGLNATLQAQKQETNQTRWEVVNPKGSHAIAVGLDAPIPCRRKNQEGPRVELPKQKLLKKAWLI